MDTLRSRLTYLLIVIIGVSAVIAAQSSSTRKTKPTENSENQAQFKEFEKFQQFQKFLVRSPATDTAEILVGAESNVCAVFPPTPPELFTNDSLPHKASWKALSNHSFTIYFASSPFMPGNPAQTITVPAGSQIGPFYVDVNSTAKDYPYTIVYDSTVPCNSYIPSLTLFPGAFAIHITK